MAKGKSYYAVQNGRSSGVYSDWSSAKSQVDGYSGSVHKSFSTRAAAEAFASGSSGYSGSSGSRSSGSGSSGSSYSGSSGSSGRSYTSSSSSSNRVSKSSSSSSKSSSARTAVYTDGACSNNQSSSSAKAGVGVYYGANHPDNVSRPVSGKQTNQRAELEAVHDAVSKVHSRNDGKSYDIKTDSQYTVDSLNKWGSKWESNGWKTSNNERVKHRDVIEPTLGKMKEMGDRVVVSKVKGHSGNKGNDAADRLAVKGSRK